MEIREARVGDEHAIAVMCALLWPDGTVEEFRREAEELIRTGMCGTLPATMLLAVEESGSAAGFLQVGLRSHADGCDTAQAVAFVEGWFVRESLRGNGIGRALLMAAEEWARANGCMEMASDALIDNEESLRAHSALGFEVVDRCVHFR